MTLITQELALAADAPLVITFLAPSEITETQTIIVGAYRLIDSRAELSAAISGEVGRATDTIRITAADPMLTPGTDGRVTITVPTETVNRSPGALSFSRSGLYPLTIEVEDDGILVGDMLTFVDRLPTPSTEASAESADPADPPAGALNVSVIASVTAPPLIPGEDSPLPDDVVRQIEQLVEYPPGLPLTVSISPEVLARVDDGTRESLKTVMSRSLVLAQPEIPLDPSAAAAGGQAETFTDLLETGENETKVLTGTRASRAAWIETDPLTTQGAALLRSLGITLLVISPETYAATGADGGFLDGYTLYSQLRDTALPNDSTLSAAITDPTVGRHLLDATMAPEMAALYTAADLVAWRTELGQIDRTLAGQSATMAVPGGGVFDYDRVTRMVEMIEPTGAATFTDLGEYQRTTDTQVVRNFETITLPPRQTVDLTARQFTIAALNAEHQVVSSMLANPAGRPQRWAQTIKVMGSSAVTDAEVAAASAAMTAELNSIKTAVVPPGPYSFTMNGLTTDLRVEIQNTSAEDLKVVVRLESSAQKMEFPDGDKPVLLLANGSTVVKIPMEARSNGSFTNFLTVLAPHDLSPIAARTTIRAQVNALTGLAQVLTGGGLLILVTWWVRNIRRGRRAQRNVRAMSVHPARPMTTALSDAAEAPVPGQPASPTLVPTSVSTATTGNATITASTTIPHLDAPSSGPNWTTLSDS